MAQVRELLARADRKGIAALYLVRRVLPADPAVPSYVLGVELTWWTRQRSRQQATVKRLAAIEWPMHLFICTLDGKYARYGKKVKAVAGAAL
jgi:hypothetical protein